MIGGLRSRAAFCFTKSFISCNDVKLLPSIKMTKGTPAIETTAHTAAPITSARRSQTSRGPSLPSSAVLSECDPRLVCDSSKFHECGPHYAWAWDGDKGHKYELNAPGTLIRGGGAMVLHTYSETFGCACKGENFAQSLIIFCTEIC